MTSETPKITIGITCYNAADTIMSAIDGALAQDWDNKEILIVDDGSKDDSVSIIEEKIKDIPSARLIRHEKNTGFAGALNTIIASASGEFVAFFDDDDISFPERVRLQAASILEYEARTGALLVVCYARTEKKYPNGYINNPEAIGSSERVPVGDDMVKFHLYLKRDPDVFYGSGTPTCSLMARLSTFRRFGNYDTSLRRNEDCDFAVRMGRMGAHFIGTKTTLVRQTPSGGADKRPEVAYESDRIFLNKYADILRQHGRYEYALAWSEIKYRHYAGQDGLALLVFLRSLLRHPVLHIAHFLRAAPRRLRHEKRMKQAG